MNKKKKRLLWSCHLTDIQFVYSGYSSHGDDTYLVCHFTEWWKLRLGGGRWQRADTLGLAVAVGASAGQSGGKSKLALVTSYQIARASNFNCEGYGVGTVITSSHREAF
jgi:hypothetical protein